MKKQLKALLLSAGFGTRLRPLTYTTPKCLVEINKQPLLHIWLDKLEELNFHSTLINTHYLSDKVYKSIEGWKNKNLRVYTTFEENLLGTAGTLVKNLEFFRDSRGLIIHADNLTTDSLSNLLDAHENRPNGTLLTMLTFETNNPRECGIVEIDGNNILKNFHEKVENPPGNLANGAVYAFSEDFIEYLFKMQKTIEDISNDLIPLLSNRIFTYKTTSSFLDIGNHANLKKANEFWRKL